MGLLDFLGTDDARLGLGLLAAGGPSATPLDFGQRLQGAMQGMDADKANKLKLEYMRSQVEENAGQTALRQQQLALAKRKFDMQAGLLGYGPTPDAGQAPGGGMAPAPGAGGGGLLGGPPAAAQGGMPSPTTPVPTARGPMTLQQIAANYKIPFESLALDLVNNEGKGIAEMVFKRGTPDMQVSNGYAYDKNRTGPGYLPQLNTSQDGKSSMIQIGPDGMPVVSAPQGAVSTYGAYEGVKNRSNADYTPETVIDPLTQQKVVRPRSQVLQPSAGGVGNVQSPGYAGGDRNAANIESIRVIETEMQKPGNSAADMAAMQREVGRLKMQSGLTNVQVAAAPMAGNVVELSPAEQSANAAAAAAAKAGAVKRAEGAAENTLAAPQKAQQAGDAIALIDKALAHPGLPTAVGLAGKIDPRNYMPGTDAQDFQRIREQLSGTAFLTAYQSLRGTGSISESEGKEAKASVARLSTAQSEPAFREALKEYRTILDRGYKNAAAQAKGETPTTPTSSSSRTVVKTGMYQGKKVIQYSDGSVDYAN